MTKLAIGHSASYGPANANAATLDGLDSAAFALLAGRAGGQTLQGGTAANDDLTLEGTAHGTKTTSYVLLQPNGGNVGINTVTPLTPLHVVGAVTITGGIRPAADGTAALTLCKANGDAVVTVDTTNGWVGIGGTPTDKLQINGANSIFLVNTLYGGGLRLTDSRDTGRDWAIQVTETLYQTSGIAGTFSIIDVANNRNVVQLDSNGFLGVNVAPATRFDIGAGAMTFAEMTAPGAGAANTARIYAKDNGSGKTQLMVQFATGSEIQIAIEA